MKIIKTYVITIFSQKNEEQNYVNSPDPEPQYLVAIHQILW